MRTRATAAAAGSGVTTLYVTHDQSEALSMSNRVAVMDGGRIVQEARPREVYRQAGHEVRGVLRGAHEPARRSIAGQGHDKR